MQYKKIKKSMSRIHPYVIMKSIEYADCKDKTEILLKFNKMM